MALAAASTISEYWETAPLHHLAITVTLSDVTSSASQVLPDTSVSANMLIGDTTADKTVSNVDVSQTRGQVGQPVTNSNFREDVRPDGSIEATDVRFVRSNVGHSLP